MRNNSDLYLWKNILAKNHTSPAQNGPPLAAKGSDRWRGQYGSFKQERKVKAFLSLPK